MKLNDRNIQTYLGQRSAYDPGSLYLGKGVSAAQKCSFLLNKGRTGLDGKYVGTGAVHYTLTGGYGVSSISWDAGDGHTYDIVYECTSANAGTLVYYKDGGARTAFAYTQYLDQAGAAYSVLPTYPTHFKPMFQMYFDVIYMAAGQIGDFRIFARNGTLYAQLTNMPPTNFMLIADNRSYVAVGNETFYRWSAPNEPERYIPKLSEINTNPPTYGIDYRLTGRSEGTSGNTVGCLDLRAGKVFLVAR